MVRVMVMVRVIISGYYYYYFFFPKLMLSILILLILLLWGIQYILLLETDIWMDGWVGWLPGSSWLDAQMLADGGKRTLAGRGPPYIVKYEAFLLVWTFLRHYCWCKTEPCVLIGQDMTTEPCVLIGWNAMTEPCYLIGWNVMTEPCSLIGWDLTPFSSNIICVLCSNPGWDISFPDSTRPSFQSWLRHNFPRLRVSSKLSNNNSSSCIFFCPCFYLITIPPPLAFGIVTRIEHHIPPQLNAVRSIRENAKSTSSKGIYQMNFRIVEILFLPSPIHLESVSSCQMVVVVLNRVPVEIKS